MAKPNFLAVLKTLRQEHVDFIVVGGVSGVLQGAPITTFDLDVVHSRDPENVTRLLKALDLLEAHYRTPGTEGRCPERSHLSSPGRQLLTTTAGPLDLLGTIGHGHTFEDLINHTIELEIEKGLPVSVLDLPTLIQVKEQTATEKDRLALVILRRTLEEKSSK